MDLNIGGWWWWSYPVVVGIVAQREYIGIVWIRIIVGICQAGGGEAENVTNGNGVVGRVLYQMDRWMIGGNDGGGQCGPVRSCVGVRVMELHHLFLSNFVPSRCGNGGWGCCCCITGIDIPILIVVHGIFIIIDGDVIDLGHDAKRGDRGMSEQSTIERPTYYLERERDGVRNEKRVGCDV